MSSFANMIDVPTLCEMIRDDNGVPTNKKINLLREQIDLHKELIELMQNKKNELITQLVNKTENG